MPAHRLCEMPGGEHHASLFPGEKQPPHTLECWQPELQRWSLQLKRLVLHACWYLTPYMRHCFLVHTHPDVFEGGEGEWKDTLLGVLTPFEPMRSTETLSKAERHTLREVVSILHLPAPEGYEYLIARPPESSETPTRGWGKFALSRTGRPISSVWAPPTLEEDPLPCVENVRIPADACADLSQSIQIACYRLSHRDRAMILAHRHTVFENHEFQEYVPQHGPIPWFLKLGASLSIRDKRHLLTCIEVMNTVRTITNQKPLHYVPTAFELRLEKPAYMPSWERDTRGKAEVDAMLGEMQEEEEEEEELE